MAQVVHLRCHHCGDLLENGDRPYCHPCDVYLAYLALPILMGMILTGHLAADLSSS